MAALTQAEIREQAACLFSGKLSLDEFRDWMVEHSLNVHQTGDEELIHLVFAFELRFAERSIGHLDDAEMIEEMKEIVAAS